MRRLVLALSVVVSLIALSILSSPSATADEVWTITGNTSVGGSAGLLLEIAEVGFPTTEIHTFIDNGRHRINALRDQGVALWDVVSPAAYLVPTTSLSINDSWAMLPTDAGAATTSTVRAIESVTVPAGTFTAYRVEVTLNSNPTTLDSVFWFANGTGLIRQDYYDSTIPANPLDTRAELSSFSIVGGTGFFPAAVGNTWSFLSIVPVEGSSWGQVKALYDR